MKEPSITSLLFSAALLALATAQCPWQRDVPELLSSCICSYNLGHELSVQCDIVNWLTLLSALNKYATATPLDLLYVNNSTVGELKANILVNLQVQSVQLSGCKIKSVHSDAFAGQEHHLKNLNLQDNELSDVPVNSLRKLRTLSLLDLSHNKISVVPSGAFETLHKLATLKLSDNNITLQHGALNGLEGCLKNLNLKGTKLKEVPSAIQGMRTLAFLDLSQNSLRELPGKNGNDTFKGLGSLTALNLERNIIQTLNDNSFQGVSKTLSSLSLLNNLLPDFPTGALSALSELRVLDIGFNLLTDLPVGAFKGNPSITLLALDGNPLATIPFEALSHLNSTLRGLSLGGRFLHCDCRLAWVINWIRNGDLQVTSRERNPQFCGSPPRFRDRGFYSIQPEELSCSDKKPTVLTTTPAATTTTLGNVKKETVAQAHRDSVGVATVVSADLDDLVAAKPGLPPSQATTTTRIPSTKSTTVTRTTSTSSSTTKVTSTTTSTTSRATTKPKVKTSPPIWKNNQKPSMVMGFPRSKAEEGREVVVKNAFRQDNSVIIQWGSDTANILGFRVVYRLFGDKSFKQGPPLEASEREFKIKNVPSQECIIVCVVSLEDTTVTPETVSYAQCREVRTVSSAASNMDKITIAASAAICGTIVVAVVVFVAASRRRSRKMHELQQKRALKHGVPIAGLPVNCCAGLPGSPGEPMSSLAALNAFNNAKDWDQVSAYSTHSQRPRMYMVDQPPSLEDMRPHFGPPKGNKPRSIADGQSQHSFSNQSGRYLTSNAFPNNLLASRQASSSFVPPRRHSYAFPNNFLLFRKDLRQSRQSLAMQSDRMSSRMAPHHLPATNSVISSTRRSRPRSRSRDHNRPSSRYSTAGSTHTLNNYHDNSDNWTDHDMEIYMARNTTRNGLVPL
ncbi:unnamed protein product [Phaedon cochleariae]|uniref:Uncharacterized protein n=1 Tax=Phaedon cochleariae TaxID=80249 RepID=A0A9P0GRG5_PHACE|nr:unnamed protein product [Phaedon cochleariae]